MDIESFFEKIPNKSNYIIDIGASHAPETDPIHTFLKRDDLKGLCVEARLEQVYMLRKNIAPTFEVAYGYITPLNVLDIFHGFEVPSSPDILKIDIDSYDLELIRVILTKYRPKIIVAEINEKIPPPIVFEVKFKEDSKWDESHFYGFSIAAGEKVMKQNNYTIVKVFDLCNILCISNDLCESIGWNQTSDIKELYRNGYVLDERRTIQMPWNENVNHWLTLEDIDLVKQDIETYFEFVNDRSISNKSFIKDIDYVLE
jgi:hypothetical protein